MTAFIDNEEEPDLRPIFSRDGRNIRVQVMISAAEYAQLDARSEDLGFSHSSYFRQLFLKDLKERAMERLSTQVLGADTAKLTQLLQLVNEIQGSKQ